MMSVVAEMKTLSKATLVVVVTGVSSDDVGNDDRFDADGDHSGS
jgi:hypothetical protein